VSLTRYFMAAEGVTLVWFGVTAVRAAAQRKAGRASPFRATEFHHAYLGAALVIATAFLPGWWRSVGMGLGWLLTLDDTFQHWRQTDGEYAYKSPLHQLYARILWPLPGVPEVTAWLDENWWVLALGAALWAGTYGLFLLGEQ
jgi:hypothetical protein